MNKYMISHKDLKGGFIIEATDFRVFDNHIIFFDNDERVGSFPVDSFVAKTSEP